MRCRSSCQVPLEPPLPREVAFYGLALNRGKGAIEDEELVDTSRHEFINSIGRSAKIVVPRRLRPSRGRVRGWR
jgi:hypothetical protein